MELKDFADKLRKGRRAVAFDGFIIFDNLELWEIEEQKSTYYKNIEELVEHKVGKKTVGQYINELPCLKLQLDGGRGQGSGAGTSLFGEQGSNPSSYTGDLPVKMQRLYNGNMNSQEHTINTFRNQHVNDNYESVISMDDNGFVYDYGHGESGAVSLEFDVTGKNIVHNHPSFGYANFSNGDLQAFASTGMKSITASSTNWDYTITKTAKFDYNKFIKAVNSAKTTESNYDKAVSKWLTANQKKYGYTYTEHHYGG